MILPRAPILTAMMNVINTMLEIIVIFLFDFTIDVVESSFLEQQIFLQKYKHKMSATIINAIDVIAEKILPALSDIVSQVFE